MDTTPGGEYLPPQPAQPQWQWAPSPLLPPPPAPPPPPQPWQLPSYPVAQPSRYTYAQPSRRGRDALIGSLVVILVVVAAVIGVSNRARPSGTNPLASYRLSTPQHPVFPAAPVLPPASAAPSAAAGAGVTASSVLSAESGTTVFEDDFTDPGSGWVTGTPVAGGDTYSFVPGGYSIGGDSPDHWLSFAPYRVPAEQLSMSVSAAETAGAATGGGYGVICRRGARSASQLRYEFIVNGTGRWFIERNQGPVTLSSGPSIVKEGTSPHVVEVGPLTIAGVCATLADGQTTRLALFMGDTEIADVTDVAPIDGQGWLGGLMGTGGDGPSTMVATDYNERSLQAADLIGGSNPVPDSSSPQLGVNT